MITNIWTVSELTDRITMMFEEESALRNLRLTGEISNFKRHGSGHWYFTLKDDHAQISAIMFQGKNRSVDFNPKDGDAVEVTGEISVYKKAGSYQIYVQTMGMRGVGNLLQAREQLWKKLKLEGLFEDYHKQELPKFPNQIAVLTSATGAAVRDIIHIINRRYPLTKILVYPTLVQGEQAKFDIVKNIELANMNFDNDVIIVGRGGGSIEDLWAFNEEIVARAIFNSKLPIISAVGHETDTTIADDVADVRAPTPSGAAEIVVPDQRTLHKNIIENEQRLEDALIRLKTTKHKLLSQFTSRYVLKDPQRILLPYLNQFERLHDGLRILHPKKRLLSSHEDLIKKEKALHFSYHLLVKDLRNLLTKNVDHLELVNPLSIMKKGYTLTRQAGKIIKSIDDIIPNQSIEVNFYNGKIEAEVLKIKKGDQNG